MNKPYDTAAILRQNVADLELELKRQKERHANASARLRDQIERVTSEWERAEAELKAALEQEPVAYVKYKATGGNVGLSWIAIPTNAYYPREGERLYTAPIPQDSIPAPAPAVPEDVLLCDTCGADCENNPWHYSNGDIRHLHACDKCYEAICEEQAPAVPEPFMRLLSHVVGLSHGTDWNKGTAANHHRAALLKAMNDASALLQSSGENHD